MEADTGSYLSSVNQSFVKNLPKAVIYPTHMQAKAYDGSKIDFLGEVLLDFCYKNFRFSHKFLVVGDGNACLLGRDLCRKLNIKLRMPYAKVNAVKMFWANTKIF